MKVKFNRAALSESLAIAGTVIPARTTKPILQGLKIEAQKDKALISATDFETGITCLVAQVQVEEKGDVVIPAERFAAIVRESADEVLELKTADGTCHVRGADSHFTIYSHPTDQYPVVPGFDGEPQVKVNLIKLQEAVEHCLFATAKENTRYALSGILWEAVGKKLTLVGTDGRRLAKYKLALNAEADKKLESEKIIVSAKAMSLLGRISAGEKDEAGIRFVDNKVVIACGNAVISSTLIEGNFPKYEDIIPTDYKNKIELNTAATLSAVRRAALLTNEDSKGVKLALDKRSLVFTSRAPEMGDAEIAMDVDYKGEAMEIGFNPQFLVDVLKVIKEDSFELQLGQSDRPGLIKSGTNYLYIVMPVSLS
ncbi:MAG: DNA polymerase III subunit beta [Sedimentisphaerales bacterium]